MKSSSSHSLHTSRHHSVMRVQDCHCEKKQDVKSPEKEEEVVANPEGEKEEEVIASPYAAVDPMSPVLQPVVDPPAVAAVVPTADAGWTIPQAVAKVRACPTGERVWQAAVSANGSDPTIVLGAGGSFRGSTITLDRTRDLCFATQQLIQELSNMSRSAEFSRIFSEGRAGNLSRDAFIRAIEYEEYAYGVLNVIAAFDECHGTWSCASCAKEWARAATSFDDYFDNYLANSHKEHYGAYWDRACRAAYEANNP